MALLWEEMARHTMIPCIHWNNTIHIPNDSLPLDIEEIKVIIKVGFIDRNFSDDMTTCS